MYLGKRRRVEGGPDRLMGRGGGWREQHRVSTSPKIVGVECLTVGEVMPRGGRDDCESSVAEAVAMRLDDEHSTLFCTRMVMSDV